MLELIVWLNEIDVALFFFVNDSMANTFTDFIMPLITKDLHLKIFYALALALILLKGRKELRWAVLFSIIVVALTDQTSSAFLKPMIERLRPCKELDVNLLVGCGAGFSMPSSHAANLFGQACFFMVIHPPTTKYLIPLAIMVALSRVFVGVHYPADILVGAALGTLIGFVVAVFFDYLYRENLSKISFGRKNNGRNTKIV